jgi:hypothetical protein
MLASGCEPQAAPPKATPHAVYYQLDWVWDRVERAPDGSWWEVMNDLGYRVRVTRGYLTSYSMELVECTNAPAAPLAAAGRFLGQLAEGVAYAGHSGGTPNPAALRAMQVESLLAPALREAGAVTLAPQAYCQLHYLVARAGRDAHGLPAALDMVDASLHIDGTYRPPGGAADVPFVVHTGAAHGALFDRTIRCAAPLRVDTGSAATRITVRRHLGAVFDGVEFARMRPPVVANRVLQSLIDHADVEITSLDDPA